MIARASEKFLCHHKKPFPDNAGKHGKNKFFMYGTLRAIANNRSNDETRSMTMTVHVAVSRTRGERDFVAGVFCTLEEGVKALELLHGEPLTVIHNRFAWALDHRGVEVGYCVETTLGTQKTRHVAGEK